MDLFTLLEAKSKMISLEAKYNDPGVAWQLLGDWIHDKIAKAKQSLIEGEDREA